MKYRFDQPLEVRVLRSPHIIEEGMIHLFELNRVTFTVHPTEEALLLKPFSAIWKRDKTKNKEKALKELGFVWFYCDVRSHFLVMEDPEKTKAIIKDLELPIDWKVDKVMKTAIDCYSGFKTQLEEMYEGAMIVADTITHTCKNSRSYVDSADDKISATKNLNMLLKELPKSMEELKKAEKQFVKELEESSGKKKGAQTFNTFEDMNF